MTARDLRNALDQWGDTPVRAGREGEVALDIWDIAFPTANERSPEGRREYIRLCLRETCPTCGKPR